MSMSKTTRDRMAQKVQKRQEEAELKHIERERERRISEDKAQLEEERQREKLRKLPNNPDMNHGKNIGGRLLMIGGGEKIGNEFIFSSGHGVLLGIAFCLSVCLSLENNSLEKILN